MRFAAGLIVGLGALAVMPTAVAHADDALCSAYMGMDEDQKVETVRDASQVAGYKPGMLSPESIAPMVTAMCRVAGSKLVSQVLAEANHH